MDGVAADRHPVDGDGLTVVLEPEVKVLVRRATTETTRLLVGRIWIGVLRDLRPSLDIGLLIERKRVRSGPEVQVERRPAIAVVDVGDTALIRRPQIAVCEPAVRCGEDIHVARGARRKIDRVIRRGATTNA